MNETRRILCLGDSNTWGFDPRSYGGDRYPPEIRWTDRLEASGRAVVNAGLNGRAIPRPGEYPDIASLFRRHAPLGAAIVMLGTNDLLEGADAAETAARMEAFLTFLTRSPGIPPLLLVAPPPLEPGEWVQSPALVRASEKLGPAFRALAERLGIRFADAGGWGIALSFDGVHFTPEGHTAFARKLGPALEKAGL